MNAVATDDPCRLVDCDCYYVTVVCNVVTAYLCAQTSHHAGDSAAQRSSVKCTTDGSNAMAAYPCTQIVSLASTSAG